MNSAVAWYSYAGIWACGGDWNKSSIVHALLPNLLIHQETVYAYLLILVSIQEQILPFDDFETGLIWTSLRQLGTDCMSASQPCILLAGPA
jgi:hypothetical protein